MDRAFWQTILILTLDVRIRRQWRNKSDRKLDSFRFENFTGDNSIQMACTSSKIKELNFWVVGRRRLKQINSKWISLGDFFICFHDAADQILIELAFDIGMCKMAI